MRINQIRMLLALLLLMCIAAINSCENDSAVPASLPSDCDTANLTYTNTMQIVINTNCGTMNNDCHSANTSHNFSTYASLQRYAAGGQNSRFWREIFVLKNMPLYPELPLDLCANNQFKIWLLNGAPQ